MTKCCGSKWNICETSCFYFSALSKLVFVLNVLIYLRFFICLAESNLWRSLQKASQVRICWSGWSTFTCNCKLKWYWCRCCHLTISILISKPTGDSQGQSHYLLLSILTEKSGFMEWSMLHGYRYKYWAQNDM